MTTALSLRRRISRRRRTRRLRSWASSLRSHIGRDPTRGSDIGVSYFPTAINTLIANVLDAGSRDPYPLDDEDIVIVEKEADAEPNVERRKSKRRSVSSFQNSFALRLSANVP